MLVSQLYQLSAQIVELKRDREHQLSMQSQLCRPILDSRPIKCPVGLQSVSKADRPNGSTVIVDGPMLASSSLYNDSTETILSRETTNQVGIEKGINSSRIKLLKYTEAPQKSNLPPRSPTSRPCRGGWITYAFKNLKAYG